MGKKNKKWGKKNKEEKRNTKGNIPVRMKNTKRRQTGILYDWLLWRDGLVARPKHVTQYETVHHYIQHTTQHQVIVPSTTFLSVIFLLCHSAKTGLQTL
jgi:hypothetical protein